MIWVLKSEAKIESEANKIIFSGYLEKPSDKKSQYCVTVSVTASWYYGLKNIKEVSDDRIYDHRRFSKEPG